MINPLLEQFNTPFNTAPFNKITNEHFLPAIKEAIEIGKQEINTITNQSEAPNFENTIVALDKVGVLINTISSIFFNLNSAETNDKIQELAQEISPLLSEYSNDILLNEALFEKIKTVYNEKNSLTSVSYTHLTLPTTPNL